MSRFTIALSGLTEAEAEAIKTTLDDMPGDAWSLVEGTSATLLIVDIDSVWGHMDWLRATANGQRVAAFSKDEHVRHCDLVLHNPLRADEMIALLQSIEAVAGENGPGIASPKSNGITSAAPPPPAEPAPVAPQVSAPETAPKPAVQPEPEPAPEPIPAPEPASEPEPKPPMTLGECLLADDLVRPVAIAGADGVELKLDPERGGYTGSTTLKPLQSLLGQPMEQAQPLDPAAVEQMRQAPAQPLTRLLWFAALSASPDQLASTLDEHANYRLTRWPQIEREFPRHFRIATAMMKGPGTLGDIASAANAPIADVADFINAYSVAGYVACDAEDTTSTDAPATTGGMFSRLRKPFSRAGQESS